jgi:hypothetical protein
MQQCNFINDMCVFTYTKSGSLALTSGSPAYKHNHNSTGAQSWGVTHTSSGFLSSNTDEGDLLSR